MLGPTSESGYVVSRKAKRVRKLTALACFSKHCQPKQLALGRSFNWIKTKSNVETNLRVCRCGGRDIYEKESRAALSAAERRALGVSSQGLVPPLVDDGVESSAPAARRQLVRVNSSASVDANALGNNLKACLP